VRDTIVEKPKWLKAAKVTEHLTENSSATVVLEDVTRPHGDVLRFGISINNQFGRSAMYKELGLKLYHLGLWMEQEDARRKT